MRDPIRIIGIALVPALLLATASGCIDGGSIFDSSSDAGSDGGGGGGGGGDGGDPGQQPEEMRRTCRDDLADVAVLPEGTDPELLRLGGEVLYLNTHAVEVGEDEPSTGFIDWVRLDAASGATLGEGSLAMDRSAMDIEAAVLPGGEVLVAAGGNGLLDLFVLPAPGAADDEVIGPFRPLVVTEAEWVPHVEPVVGSADEEGVIIDLFVMRADALLGVDTRIERIALTFADGALAAGEGGDAEPEAVVTGADASAAVDWLSPMEVREVGGGRTLLFGRRAYTVDGAGAIQEVGDHASLAALRLSGDGAGTEAQPFGDELMATFTSVVESDELWVASTRVTLGAEGESDEGGLVWSVLSAAGDLVTERPLAHPDGRVPPVGLAGGPLHLAVDEAGRLVVSYLAGHERNYVFHVLLVDPVSGALVDDGVVDFSGARFAGCQVLPAGADEYWYLLGRTTADSDGTFQLRAGYCSVDY